MTSVSVCFTLCLLVCLVSATPLPQGGSNFTMQQLHNAMSQIIVENVNLKMNLKTLKDENGKLTSTLSQTEAQRATCEYERMTKKQHLNASKEDHTVCASVKVQLEGENKKLTTDLGQCKTATATLLQNQLISQHVLNASHIAKNACKLNLGHCKATLAEFLPSCKAWFNAGYTKDGDYVIDPDGPGGVGHLTVECDMSNHYGEPITIMHHDSESRMDAGPNNLEPGYSNVRNVVYKVSLQQITEVIKLSAKCEQYIKYECYHSGITHKATWYSRDGTPMYYWGGAAPGSGNCACGMTNSCDMPGKFCNCDANDYVWRSDSGLLIDKNTLPVTKMAFGDLNAAAEAGYHRLGALRCYG